MEKVQINTFSDPSVVRAIALAYQQAFGGEPWNEGSFCPLCKTVFPLADNIEICPECSTRLVECWPIDKVVSDFNNEMAKPDSICIVAQRENQIIGFAWGYLVSSNPALDAYLDAPNVHTSLQGDFFYLDECALIPAYQRKGIGKVLVNEILSKQQCKQILLRTKSGSRMESIVLHLGGEIIQHITRERVIMKLIIS